MKSLLQNDLDIVVYEYFFEDKTYTNTLEWLLVVEIRIIWQYFTLSYLHSINRAEAIEHFPGQIVS